MTVLETMKTVQSLTVASMLGTSTHSCGIISDTGEEEPWYFNHNVSTSLSIVMDDL